MQRRERFPRVFFPETVLRDAASLIPRKAPESELFWLSPKTTAGAVSWDYDNEIEFFADYNPGVSHASIGVSVYTPEGAGQGDFITMNVTYSDHDKSTTVQVDAKRRADLLKPFAAFRNVAKEHRIPDPTPPATFTPPPLKIFIGHGRSHDWRDLKDALHDHHGFDVEAFETKPRAGYTIPEVIEGMARGNALALLVLTPEDEQPDGTIRARESVVHEVGYFQGRLGSKRPILLMKEGVNEFSNVHGIVHVPYKSIREVVGEVLAIIKREFPHLAK